MDDIGIISLIPNSRPFPDNRRLKPQALSQGDICAIINQQTVPRTVDRQALPGVTWVLGFLGHELGLLSFRT